MPFMFLMSLQASTTTTMQQLKHQGTFQKGAMHNFLRLMGSEEKDFYDFGNDTILNRTVEQHLDTLR
jgi:hypothetical protein